VPQVTATDSAIAGRLRVNLLVQALPGPLKKFVDAFVRNQDGSWFCRAPAQLIGANGPFTATPGATYRLGRPINGYDIAQWLDVWSEQRIAPIGVEFL
jgi:hypothetical protein